MDQWPDSRWGAQLCPIPAGLGLWSGAQGSVDVPIARAATRVRTCAMIITSVDFGGWEGQAAKYADQRLTEARLLMGTAIVATDNAHLALTQLDQAVRAALLHAAGVG